MSLRNSILIAAVSGSMLSACSSGPKPLEVTLQASEFRFEPATIEVQAGQQLTIVMDNIGTVEHDFVILEIPIVEMDAHAEEEQEGHAMEELSMEMEPALHMGAMSGMTDSLTFVPTKPGTYEFFCAVPGHTEAGMVGMLLVSER